MEQVEGGSGILAQRYCTNCGNELGPNDVFCASCGKPTHETAAVSTPEADVGVPQPRRDFSEEDNPPTEGRPRVSLITFLVVVVVILFGMVALFGQNSPDQARGGGGGGGGGDSGGDGGQAASSASASSDRTFTEDDYSELFSDPDAYVGASVDVAGQLLERPDNADGELAFQMFVDIENSDWNTIVYTDQTDLDLNSDDYVQVRGEVLGAFDGENAFGGAITAPMVQADEVSPVSAGQALDPATEVIGIAQTLGDQGFDVTLQKIEFGEESTRAYVTLANNTGAGASFYTFDANIVQGSTQIDYLEDSYAYYEEEPQETIRPGVQTEGVIAFGPVDPDQPFELRIPWSSDNFNITSRPIVFQVSPG